MKIVSDLLEKFHRWNLRIEIKVALIGFIGVVVAAALGGVFMLAVAFVPVIFNSKPSENKTEIYNVSSNYQSGGVTAGIVNTQRSARHLNDNLERQLSSVLLKDKVPIVINSAINDSEAYTFAEEIANYLKADGWTVEHLQAIWSPPFIGQRISPLKNGKITIDVGSRE